MSQAFLEKICGRIKAAWDVLTGRAWAGYGSPMDWQYVGRDDA